MPSHFHFNICKIFEKSVEEYLVGNKYRTSDFLKKQRNKDREFLLDTLQSKQKMNNKYSQGFLFLMYRKNLRK